MPKLTKKQLQKRDELAIFYRWEFLRRNKNYCKDLKKLRKDTEKQEQVPLENNKEFEKSCMWVKNSWEGFAKQWGLMLAGDYFPLPEKEFNMLTDREKIMLLSHSTKPGWPQFVFIANAIIRQKMKILNFPIYNEKTLDSIKIEINLNFPNHKIMREIEYIVQIMKSLRKKKGFKDNAKPRYDAYNDFLKIYDLRENKNMKYKNICVKVLKKDIRKVTREDEDKIAKAYKRAKKIVQSEYRNIW
jgi:hypothetical protein